MSGARFLHDTLEQLGWDVLIAAAQRVKGLAPIACKTDRVDSRVLAVLSHRDLVPAIWLPDPRVRRQREQARFRLHLVKHKSMLEAPHPRHLMTFGHPCPVTDLFGLEGDKLLERLELPEPWSETVDGSARSRESRHRGLTMIVGGIASWVAGIPGSCAGELGRDLGGGDRARCRA